MKASSRWVARAALAWLVCSLASARLRASDGQQGASSIPNLLAELESATPTRTTELARELAKLGAPAAQAALELWPRADLRTKRALAFVAREAGDATCAPAAVRALLDPDREVRESMLALLSKPELGARALELRVEGLARAAAEDPDVGLRASALQGLARMDGEAVGVALERLALELPAPERRYAARALAAQASARQRVVELVQRAFAESAAPSSRSTPSDDVLEVLLGAAYGVALAELPAGGEAPLDRVPFVLGARHPSPGVRAAAARALDGYVGRLRFLGAASRAERVLGLLLGQGLDDSELLVRRATLVLEEGLDPELALGSARELLRRSALLSSVEERQLHASGALLEIAALIASDRAAEVGSALDEGRRTLEALARERLELRSKNQALVEGDVYESLAVLELYAVMALAAQGTAGDDPGLLDHARAAHANLLRQQLVATAATGPTGGSLDPLFAHPLGPFALHFSSEGTPRFPRARSLELELLLYRALATVAPREMPGFEPFQATVLRLGDVLLDPERLDLLRKIQSSQIEYLTEERDRTVRAQRAEEQRNGRASDALGLKVAQLTYLLQELKDAARRDREEAHRGLLDLRPPCSAGLTYAARLREDGRFGPSRAVAERMLEDLGKLEGTRQPRWIEFLTARTELTLGSAWMDENDPRKAEEVLLHSLARLDAIEREMQESGAEPSQLALVRGMRSSALVSLAVNANVKLGDTARALAYFERAYELRQDDFMRVLLACYRARAGRADDARDVLRDTPVSPPNFYNLACTYALLGERELALDFLRRDFAENHASDGSLERQKEWARADPDLASLRADPAFVALLEPGPAGGGKAGERERNR